MDELNENSDSESLFQQMLEKYYASHDKYSIRISWHTQHAFENILDLKGFRHSISKNLEEEKIEEPITSFPLGYFQIEQPSRIRYAYLIFLFTILERRVRAVVKLTLELKKDAPKELSDYKGAFLDRVRQFMLDNMDFDISTYAEWQQVMLFQKVRDCIIHCGGNIHESRDKNYLQSLADKGIFELNGNGYIRINKDFCGEMESIVHSFISVGLEKLYYKLWDIESQGDTNN
ncbi:hypothetical protein [Xanthocytophaga flava]|uniref:hypothetical protein n=1 Tax=Xanthocytophaga flava TaxID=3048013 RepID=UPI0028D1F221|nr:hypothetical protein [Xanthocytophaga flavus]MDJ1472857.1 hypothetical protein [Xanthocytophaga flavus]